MKIMPLGINYSTEKLLNNPIDQQDFAKKLLDALGRNVEFLRTLTRSMALGETFRGEVKRKKADLGDPRKAGWTFLVNSKDPRKSQLVKSIKRLAEHRGMNDPAQPLLFNGEPPEEYQDWLMENYSSLRMDEKPHYILILGSPQEVPFLFQSMLAVTAAVGRLDFDTADDLEAYVEKVIRLEIAKVPVVNREALFFAPDEGPGGPTYFSHHYLAKPLAQRAETVLKFEVKALFAADATKKRLQEVFGQSRPAFVFVASHGVGWPDAPIETQKQVHGAIVCQPTKPMKKADLFFCASDVPDDQPFLEGAAFFQFGCYGYGTPAESDFAHWMKGSKNAHKNSEADFVAALPKKLLSHPRGPITYVGHVDIAILQGFDDPQNPIPIEGQYHDRIEPFVRALDQLLGVNPAGIAMEDMNQRYNLLNAVLTGIYDRLEKGKLQVNAEFVARLTDWFLRRNDAQNYMIFGDPAARLRIPS